MEELLLRHIDQRWSDVGSSTAPPEPRVHIHQTPNQGRTLVLADAVVPDQIVLSVPPSALLNLKTIRDVFPSALLPRPAPLWTPLPEPPTRPSDDDQPGPAWGMDLRAEPGSDDSGDAPGPLSHVSLVCFFLALCRQFPRDHLPHRLVTFIPMIDSMPDSLFTTHPLWTYLYVRGLICPPRHAEDFYETLWKSFSPRVHALVKDIYRRFRHDWVAVRRAYQHIPTSNALRDTLFSDTPTPGRYSVPLPFITIEVFIWAWLCVNTRCLFYNMHLAPQQQNFTLMPVIDMANHTNDPATTFKIEVTTHGGLEFRAPPGAEAKKDGDHWRGLRRGDPVCLNYGPHSNSFLFAEYGFVLTNDDGTGWNRYNDLVLDDQVDEYINQTLDAWGLQQAGDPLHPRTVLEEAGYGGDWTVQEQPVPAHPSWRTTMAMWCLSCYSTEADRTATQRALSRWHKAVSGLVPSAGDPAAAARIFANILAAATKTFRARFDALAKFKSKPSTSSHDTPSPDQRALVDMSTALIAAEDAMVRSLIGRIQALLDTPDPDWREFWDA